MTDWQVTGIDVSEHQGLMDWGTARPFISFAFIRAGCGVIQDVQYERNASECWRLGIPFGVYWAVLPNISWSIQINKIMASIDGQLPYVLDIERDNGMTKTQMQAFVRYLLLELNRQMVLLPLIYTGPYFWSDHVGPLGDIDNDLWIANYTTAEHPTMPNDWYEWRFWQHSSPGNDLGGRYGAQSDDIDLNRYNGTAAQFENAYGPGGIVDPPPPQPAEQVKVYNCNRLNVRKNPNLAADQVIGTVPAGTVFTVAGAPDGDWVPIVCWAHRAYLQDL